MGRIALAALASAVEKGVGFSPVADAFGADGSIVMGLLTDQCIDHSCRF